MKKSYLLLALILSACSLLSGPQATSTSLPVPTETPTPEPPLIILLAPQGSDPELAAATAEIVGTFAGSHAMQFQQVDNLDATQLPSNLATLVILGPDPGANQLATTAASAKVITIGFSLENAPANVQTLLASTDLKTQVAFIAGYTAELVATDWRAGMLYTPQSQELVDSFVAGGRYFCGSCTPEGPPYTDYPHLAQAVDTAQWQAGADELISLYVNVVYLAPELEGSGVEQYLAAYSILLIGSGNPPAGLEANWVGGITGDPIAELRQSLPQSLAGEPIEANNALSIVSPNPSYLSEGRLANIQVVINDVLSGYIILSGQQ